MRHLRIHPQFFTTTGSVVAGRQAARGGQDGLRPLTILGSDGLRLSDARLGPPSVPPTVVVKTAEPIPAALEVAYRIYQQDTGPC
ncbi:hypothetical protein ACWEQA_05850 [Nocardia sp. NPDC004085]